MPGDLGAAGSARIDVLGALEVVADDGSRRAVAGRQQRTLLSLLVLHRDRPVPVHLLVEGLWGERAPRGAEVTLRSHVSHLRRLLTDVGLGQRLQTGPAGYRLAIPRSGADVDRFEELVGAGQEALALGDGPRASTHLRQALALWRGRPYPDLDDVDGAEPEVTRLEGLRLTALEAVVDAELAAGRHREVVGELEALVAAHPFHERFCAQLVVALYRSGRQAEALAVFSQARARLADELGLDPGRELQELYGKVLRQDPELLGDDSRPTDRGAGPPEGAGSDHPRDAVLSAMARHRLVGRGAEVARLDAAWQHAADGGRGLVLVSGPAGIGKTHLLAELAEQAADTGRPVLIGRCGTSHSAFEPVARALTGSGEARRLFEDGAAALPPVVATLLGMPSDEPRAPGATGLLDTGEDSVAAGVATVLRRLAVGGPVLLALDDADRVDPSTAVLLGHLVERLPVGVLVVLAYRDPPGTRHPPLLGLLGRVAAAVPERIVLAPLTEPDVVELVQDRAGGTDGADGGDVGGGATALGHRLWEHTGGNPFYVVELASVTGRGGGGAGGWPVPTGVRDVLRHRLADLSEQAREVLPVAAVLGADVDVELLAQVTGARDEEVARALDEGVAAGLLLESGDARGGHHTFPQAVVRDALRAELAGARLRGVHLGAAEALQRSPRRVRGQAAAIADHLHGAGGAADPELTARFDLLAATEAASVFAWDDALGRAETAVALLGETGPRAAHARAAVTTAMLWLRSGRGHRRGLELLEAALPDYLAAGDEEAAGGVHSRLGGALCLHHSVMDVPRALEHFDAAERLLPSPDTEYHLHRGRAQAAMLGLRSALLEQAGLRAEEIAASLGRRDLGVVPGWARGWAAVNTGRLADGLALWEAGWRTAHERSDAYLAWSPVNAAAMVLNVHLLDPTAARGWCRRGLGQPRFTSFVQPHDAVVDHLALALAALGQVDDARATADRLPTDAGSRRMLLLLDGRWEEAAASWAGAVASDEAAGDLHDAATNLRWLAEVQLALGDRDGALDSLERALALAVEGPQVPTELDARARLARLRAAEDLGVAAGHLARCDEILAAGEDWRGAVATVDLARAAVAATGGDAAAADTASGRAVEVLTAHRLPWREAAALDAWARLLHARGEHHEATERWRLAREVYGRVGATDRWLEGLGG